MENDLEGGTVLDQGVRKGLYDTDLRTQQGKEFCLRSCQWKFITERKKKIIISAFEA